MLVFSVYAPTRRSKYKKLIQRIKSFDYSGVSCILSGISSILNCNWWNYKSVPEIKVLMWGGNSCQFWEIRYWKSMEILNRQVFAWTVPLTEKWFGSTSVQMLGEGICHFLGFMVWNSETAALSTGKENSFIKHGRKKIEIWHSLYYLLLCPIRRIYF